MSLEVSDNEFLQVFVKNAMQKIQELNGFTHILMQEGPSAEIFEAIYRSALKIKSFASTCNLQNIVNFINTVINVQFDNIRLEKSHDISEEDKQKIKSNLAILKNMVIELQEKNPVSHAVTLSTSSTSDDSIVSIDKNTALLQAIGQLSVWGFHDILNSLAKIEGFADIIHNICDKLDEKDTLIKHEIKLNLNKTLDNTHFMTDLINHIRSLRGKTIVEPKEYHLKELIENLEKFTPLSPNKKNWVLPNLPSVSVQCDKIIFSQLWANLWKLLQEWQIPGAIVTPTLKFKIESNPDISLKTKFKNTLFLYIWTEAADSTSFQLQNLNFSKQTPFPDLSHIFYFTTKVAQKMGIDVCTAKTPSNNALFRIQIACSDMEDNEQTQLHNSEILKSTTSHNKTSSAKSILVVDDEKDLRTILSMKINRMGYVVYTASNLHEAIHILNEKNIDLVISDLFIQGESGLDLLKSLSAARPELPFVFISGADEDDVPASIFNILSNYAKAFLTKPVATHVLKENIEKIIGSSSRNN